jgi:hypothetical protein
VEEGGELWRDSTRTEVSTGADRGPRAGSPHGVVDATGSRPSDLDCAVGCDPVATAPGTDLKLSHGLDSVAQAQQLTLAYPLINS